MSPEAEIIYCSFKLVLQKMRLAASVAPPAHRYEPRRLLARLEWRRAFLCERRLIYCLRADRRINLALMLINQTPEASRAATWSAGAGRCGARRKRGASPRWVSGADLRPRVIRRKTNKALTLSSRARLFFSALKKGSHTGDITALCESV